MKKRDVWRLSIFTFIACFLPCLIRYLAAPLTKTHEWDLKDFVYATLAMLLSTVALLESQPEITNKKTLLNSCWLFISLSTISIMLLIIVEGDDTLNIPRRIYVCSGISFISSIYFGFRANLKIIKTLKPEDHA